MRGALLWTRRGTWWRRICWRAARSASWRRLDGEAVTGTVASSGGGSNEGLLIGAIGLIRLSGG